jgi:crotonobetainyl-CoA:carnitine CoA-transferase CaiB-like acyl-CoA transferase
VQLAARGIVCVPAVTSSLAAVLRDDPLARRCRLVGEAQSREWGTYTRHGRMVDFVGAPPLRGAPQLGEHSRALLEELGFGPADAMRLFTAQVVADAR